MRFYLVVVVVFVAGFCASVVSCFSSLGNFFKFEETVTLAVDTLTLNRFRFGIHDECAFNQIAI